MDLKLYHSVESTCAQKVRLVLAEKALDWQEQRINLRRGEQFAPEYLKLNPKAVVPTLVHGRHVIRESTVINEYLDDRFPDVPLKPADPAQRAAMRIIVKTFDDDVHPAVGILSYAIVLRHQMNELKSPEQLQRHFDSIVDPMRRERQRGTHAQGLRAPSARNAITNLRRVARELEQTLAGGQWLAGATYSLADAAVLPYLVRIEALNLSELWARGGKLADWLERARQRDNCARLTDPWGPPAFRELVRTYAEAAQPELRNILAG